MTSRIDHLLAKVSLIHRPYTDQEIEAAELRVAARISEQMLHGALTFDDEMWLTPETAGCLRSVRSASRCADSHGLTGEARRDLKNLCRTVVEQDGALQHMSAFLGQRILQPDGARVLACVLQLAGREDSARFWWQFAAGAGDLAAAYCLYLHHVTLGELWEAELWRKQADPDHEPDPVADEQDGSHPGLVLRVLGRLRGERLYLTAAASAVIHYVPGAVHFVDEVELPLPVMDFAQRIEELTAPV